MKKCLSWICFEYDALDRLTASQAILDRADRHGLNNADFNRRFDYDYDALGNLKGKTDIGAYEYRGAGPHAVSKAKGITFTYDKVGNLLKGETETTDAAGTAKKVVERSLEWSSFNKPTKITRNGHTVEFAYDANHSRYYRKDSSGEETFYFDKLYERVKDVNSGEVQHKQYIYADGKLIALNIEQYDSANKFKERQIRYLHYDALGSVDLITDGYGLVVERRSFDPWGKARKLQWRDINDASTLLQFTLTNRGFTGHEHLKEVGMIHMNGRVYDQELGRFLSADPIVQSPYMTDSFNRYSYVTNNPLKYTDPTGFIQTEFGDNNGGRYVDVKGNHHKGAKRIERKNAGGEKSLSHILRELGNSTVDIDSFVKGYLKSFLNDFREDLYQSSTNPMMDVAFGSTLDLSPAGLSGIPPNPLNMDNYSEELGQGFYDAGGGYLASAGLFALSRNPKSFVKKATDLPVLKPRTKEWMNAVENLSGLGKGKLNFRTETATDAKALLNEARGNMDRLKNYTKQSYKKGYETHNVQNSRELGAGNDLQHLKWKDGKSGGHIYYEKSN